RILRSIPLLDAAALDAVRQWEYTPTALNGQPVPVIMTVTVNFAIQPSGASPPIPSAVPPGVIRLSAARKTTAAGDEWEYWEVPVDRVRQLPPWDAAQATPARLSVEGAVTLA